MLSPMRVPPFQSATAGAISPSARSTSLWRSALVRRVSRVPNEKVSTAGRLA